MTPESFVPREQMSPDYDGGGAVDSKNERHRSPEELAAYRLAEEIRQDIKNGEALAWVRARTNVDIGEEGTVVLSEKYPGTGGYQDVMVRGSLVGSQGAGQIVEALTNESSRVLEGNNHRYRVTKDGGIPMFIEDSDYNRPANRLYVSVAMPGDFILPPSTAVDKLKNDALVEIRYQQRGVDSDNRTGEKRLHLVVPKQRAETIVALVESGLDPEVLKDAVSSVYVEDEKVRDSYFEASLLSYREYLLNNKTEVLKKARTEKFDSTWIQVSDGSGVGASAADYAKARFKKLIPFQPARGSDEAISSKAPTKQIPTVVIEQPKPEIKEEAPKKVRGALIMPPGVAFEDDTPLTSPAPEVEADDDRDEVEIDGDDSGASVERGLPWVDAGEVTAVEQSVPAKKEKGAPKEAVERTGIGYYEAKNELSRIYKTTNTAGRALTAEEKSRTQYLEDIVAKADSAAKMAFDNAMQPGTIGASNLSKIELLIGRYATMSDSERENLKRLIKIFNIPGVGYEEAAAVHGVDSQVVREAGEQEVANRRALLESDLLRAVNTYERTPEFVMPFVYDAKLPLRDRLSRVEKLDLAGQRNAIRYLLRSEFEKPENLPGTAEFNKVRSDLDALKDHFHESVRREIDARVHLQAVSASLRKMNTGDVANISNEFNGAVRTIGALVINNEDLNFFLGDDKYQVDGQSHGLKVRAALEVMDELAEKGHYSGKKTQAERLLTKDILRQQVSSRTGLVDSDALDEVLMLADNLAEAIFLKARWDTSGGEYGAQSYLAKAFYYTASRIQGDKAKPPTINIFDIAGFGGGFMDSLKGPDGDHLFFAERSRGIKERPFLERKIRGLSRSTILLESTILDMADWDIEKPQDKRDFISDARGVLGSRLDFRGVDFRVVSSQAYADYLKTKVSDIIKAYDLLTNTKITYQDLITDGTIAGYGKILDDVDPDNLYNLRYYFALGAISVALDNGMEESERKRAVTNLLEVKTEGGRKTSFLPYPQEINYRKMIDDRLKRNGQRNQGLGNAIVTFLERRVRVSK